MSTYYFYIKGAPPLGMGLPIRLSPKIIYNNPGTASLANFSLDNARTIATATLT